MMNFYSKTVFIEMLVKLYIILHVNTIRTMFGKTITKYKWNFYNPLTYIVIACTLAVYILCILGYCVQEFIKEIAKLNITDISEEYYDR